MFMSVGTEVYHGTQTTSNLLNMTKTSQEQQQ